MIVKAIFILLAAICKAVADTLIHHFDSSIFYKANSQFWNLDVSNKNPIYVPFTKYKINAWHVFNSAMIIFFVTAIFKSWLYILISGAIFIVVFNIFYNKLFRKL